jgi:hypothetical protein
MPSRRCQTPSIVLAGDTEPRRCAEGARHLQLGTRVKLLKSRRKCRLPNCFPCADRCAAVGAGYRSEELPLRSWASQRPAILATGSEAGRLRASARTARQPARPVDVSAWAECRRTSGAGSRRSGTRRRGASAPRTPGAASIAAERTTVAILASETSSRTSGPAASGRTTPRAASARARRVGKARASLATASSTGAAAEPTARHSATVTVR